MFHSFALRLTILCLILVVAAGRSVWSAEEGDVAQPQVEPEWREKIHRALDKPVTLEVKKIPLVDVVTHLGKQAGVDNVVIDTLALDNEGIGTETPITKDLKGLSLRNMLRHTLKELDLTYMLRDGALVITTPEVAEWQRYTRVFNVVDLVRPHEQAGPEEYDYDKLIELITCTIAPCCWVDVGGSGSIEAFRGTLIVDQTQDVLDEIPDLLAALREARKLYEKHGKKTPPVTSIPIGRDPDQEVEPALLRKGSFKFVGMPLVDVADHLKEIYRVEIQLDDRALDDVGIASDVPITFTANGLSLRHALRHMLRELDLTYVPRDGVVLITTPEESETMPRTRLYPVADLVLGATPPPNWLPNTFGTYGDFDSIIEVITSIVMPTTWCDAGGPGSIEGDPHSMSLVVAQTNEVHEQIEELLVKLRKSIPKEASAEATSKKDDDNDLRLVIYFVTTKSTVQGQKAKKKQDTSESQADQRLPEEAQCHFCIGPTAFARLVSEKAGLFEDDELLQLIQEMVEPDSWKKEGVFARAAPGRLIIRQSPEVHRKIGETLRRLRVFYEDETQMPDTGYGTIRMRSFRGGMGGMGGGMGTGNNMGGGMF